VADHPRHRWIVDRLALRGDEAVLEVGGGPGVTADLVCRRLDDGGRYVGVDRSAAQVRAAEQRLSGHADARVLCSTLVDADLGDERFDLVIAAQVALFVRSPGPELAVIRRHLAPEGALHLFLHPFTAEQLPGVRSEVETVLPSHGWVVADVHVDADPGLPGLHAVVVPG
jgi:cyclopropane fatty-acyl-phospholipid synthase-like methyltransferase